jgi:hypothetical protein
LAHAGLDSFGPVQQVSPGRSSYPVPCVCQGAWLLANAHQTAKKLSPQSSLANSSMARTNTAKVAQNRTASFSYVSPC